MSKISVDLKVGEVMSIGSATVRLVKKSGQLARLEITADQNTTITPPRQRSSASQLRDLALQSDK